MTNKPTWEIDFINRFVRSQGINPFVDSEIPVEKYLDFISTKLAEQRKEIIEIIKTPMSTKFEDPEEESADYSIEDFRARLINLIRQ